MQLKLVGYINYPRSRQWVEASKSGGTVFKNLLTEERF